MLNLKQHVRFNGFANPLFVGMVNLIQDLLAFSDPVLDRRQDLLIRLVRML